MYMVPTYVSVDEIQEGEKKVLGDSSKRKSQTGNLIMHCLQVNISDRYPRATNGFYSTLFGLGHVGNRDTKVFIYSCNIPHFTMCRTQAKKPHINCLILTAVQLSVFKTRSTNVRSTLLGHECSRSRQATWAETRAAPNPKTY